MLPADYRIDAAHVILADVRAIGSHVSRINVLIELHQLGEPLTIPRELVALAERARAILAGHNVREQLYHDPLGDNLAAHGYPRAQAEPPETPGAAAELERRGRLSDVSDTRDACVDCGRPTALVDRLDGQRRCIRPDCVAGVARPAPADVLRAMERGGRAHG